MGIVNYRGLTVGHEGKLTKNFIHHLSIAMCSRAELETHIIICQRLRYITVHRSELLLRETAEIGRIINSLIKSLKSK